MSTRSNLVLKSILHMLHPAVRLMLRHGVTYTAFAAALKPVFLKAAQDELKASAMAPTDSAISLLSGVHRRDVRNLTRLGDQDAQPEAFAGLAAQVVARWMSQDLYLDDSQTPIQIARAGPTPSFDALVYSVSRDVRPRSVLDELIRLGLAAEEAGQISLLVHGFVPRNGLAEMATQLGENLHDHVAAACHNLDRPNPQAAANADSSNIPAPVSSDFLEQSVFVDDITADSAERLHATSALAWKLAFQAVMRDAQRSFDHDAVHAAPAQRTHRARFGVYFYSMPAEVNAQSGPELGAKIEVKIAPEPKGLP